MSLPASSPFAPQSDPHIAIAVPRLNSWKEIATYFDRDIRTVQLWEKREALPIHRHEHSTRSSVYAYPSELDTWLRTRRHERASAAPKPIAPLVARSSRLTRALLAIAIAAVPMTALAAWGWHLRRPTPAIPFASDQTLAVLPFEDLSPDGSGNVWVYGFTDDLIADLGTTEHLRVISRRSVMPFTSSHGSLPDIARKLHATLILEGTVAHQNGAARISAQLLDVAHDHQLWAGSYSRKTNDILSLQDEVAADITTAVTGKLTGTIPQLSVNTHPVDPQARLAYLTGVYFLNLRDQPSMLKAVDAFHQAIAKDPHYAAAYAGLADCYNLLAVWGNLPSSEAFRKARSAAQTALSLDPTSAQGYTSLAFETYRYEWNFSLAELYFRKAIELNPNYVTAHQWYGEFLGDLRRFDQSIAELRTARDLDPLSAIAGSDLATGYMHAGRDPEAIAELHRILALYPNFAPAHIYLASCYHDIGDLTNAEREVTIYSRLTGDSTSQQSLRSLDDAHSGNLSRARAELHTLLTHHPIGFYQQAQLYFAVNEPGKAYVALDKAYAEHSWWLVTLMVDPGFTSVRDQPQFRKLMLHVGLPVPANRSHSAS